MRNIKSTKLYRRNAAALATHIDRRRLARELRKVGRVLRNRVGVPPMNWRTAHLVCAFVFADTPQGFQYWRDLYDVVANIVWSPEVPVRIHDGLYYS